MIDLSWPVVAALFITLPFVGRLLDAGLYTLRGSKTSEYIYWLAIRLDELSYVELAHRDTKIAYSAICKIFGEKAFSMRLALIPILFLLIAFIFIYVETSTQELFAEVIDYDEGWREVALDIGFLVLLILSNLVAD